MRQQRMYKQDGRFTRGLVNVISIVALLVVLMMAHMAMEATCGGALNCIVGWLGGARTAVPQSLPTLPQQPQWTMPQLPAPVVPTLPAMPAMPQLRVEEVPGSGVIIDTEEIPVMGEFLHDCLQARLAGRRSSPRCADAIREMGTGR